MQKIAVIAAHDCNTKKALQYNLLCYNYFAKTKMSILILTLMLLFP